MEVAAVVAHSWARVEGLGSSLVLYIRLLEAAEHNHSELSAADNSVDELAAELAGGPVLHNHLVGSM